MNNLDIFSNMDPVELKKLFLTFDTNSLLKLKKAIEENNIRKIGKREIDSVKSFNKKINSDYYNDYYNSEFEKIGNVMKHFDSDGSEDNKMKCAKTKCIYNSVTGHLKCTQTIVTHSDNNNHNIQGGAGNNKYGFNVRTIPYRNSRYEGNDVDENEEENNDVNLEEFDEYSSDKLM